MRTFEVIPGTSKITSVDSFLQELANLPDEHDRRVYFRGLSDAAYKLVPSVGRRCEYLGTPHNFTPRNEAQMLSRFRRYAFSQWNRIPTAWEALFLSRHYGLPVRLLDWTSNPLVGLYFACAFKEATANQTDGAIWAIQRYPDETHDLLLLDAPPHPLMVRGIKLVYPSYTTPRMTAQASVFTIQEHPQLPLEDSCNVPYPNKTLDIKTMRRWIIDKASKRDIIIKLETLGINSRTLFPDLSGIAEGIWQTVILREGKSCSQHSVG